MANLYVRVGGGGGIECGAAHKTGARETRESEAGGVHTGPQTMAAASRRLTCRLAPCTYTHIIFDAGLLDNKHNAVSSMSLWWLSSGVQSFC